VKFAPQLIIFVVDGVLVDVRGSFHRSILDTVRHFTGRRFTYADIQQWKRKTGYNDDWRLTTDWCNSLGQRVTYPQVKRQFQKVYWGVNGSRGNVDHVVVGPCGVVVIETKRWVGLIRCDGDDWYVNGHRTGSVSRQVKRGAVAVRGFLAARYPDVQPGYVQSIAVFTHPLCRLKVNHAQTTVVRYSELMQLMLELGRRRRMSPPLARRLAESLAGSSTAGTSGGSS